ncbi:hypothetical protein AN958_03944 [Leucoagaricus sp. SymC.cos]|nr:hypothetical protein AN958_03944 [Leucoagaricus sp. SymC.cos]
MENLPYGGVGHPPALNVPLTRETSGPDRHGKPDAPPTRPPRPPTSDSPAAIDSLYYTDVDDRGFYSHPNPIVLEPTSPIINNPPPMPGTNAQPHLNFLPLSHRFFSSNALGTDALLRHNRSRSAPTLDTVSTSSTRLSGATTVTLETSRSSGMATPQIPHRKCTSAVSWIRYSEFQQQHHLRLQRQSSPVERSVSGPATGPSRERGGVGSAY